jgi:hypothetical protein
VGFNAGMENALWDRLSAAGEGRSLRWHRACLAFSSGVVSACRQCITYVDTNSPGADPGPVVIACHDQRVNSARSASLSTSSDLWRPGRGSSASPTIRRSANSERTCVPSPWIP